MGVAVVPSGGAVGVMAVMCARGVGDVLFEGVVWCVVLRSSLDANSPGVANEANMIERARLQLSSWYCPKNNVVDMRAGEVDACCLKHVEAPPGRMRGACVRV